MTYATSYTGLTDDYLEELVLKKKNCDICVQTKHELEEFRYDTIVSSALSSISVVKKSSIINPELSSVSEVQSSEIQC